MPYYTIKYKDDEEKTYNNVNECIDFLNEINKSDKKINFNVYYRILNNTISTKCLMKYFDLDDIKKLKIKKHNTTRKEYYLKNREKILDYCKEYHKKNKERILEYKKKYKMINKDKIQQKFICDICNGRYTHNHRSEHLKTKKHINALNN